MRPINEDSFTLCLILLELQVNEKKKKQFVFIK